MYFCESPMELKAVPVSCSDRYKPSPLIKIFSEASFFTNITFHKIWPVLVIQFTHLAAVTPQRPFYLPGWISLVCLPPYYRIRVGICNGTVHGGTRDGPSTPKNSSLNLADKVVKVACGWKI